MNIDPHRPPPLPKKKRSMLPLVLGLAPSVLLLLLLMFAGHSGKISSALLLGLCVISVICCFASGILLLRRNTALTILLGVLFLLLNAGISFFLGCVAILNGMKF